MSDLSKLGFRLAEKYTCGSTDPLNHPNLSHPSPLVWMSSRNDVEESAVRPAALSNPYPQPGFAMQGRSIRLSNKINPPKSNIQLIWTALAECAAGEIVECSPGRQSWGKNKQAAQSRQGRLNAEAQDFSRP
jgi:hypothetical protein